MYPYETYRVSQPWDRNYYEKPDLQYLGAMLTGDCIIKAVECGDIFIENFDETKVNENSYNLTLSNQFKTYSVPECGYLDTKVGADTVNIPTGEDGGIIIHPSEFILGMTEEHVHTDKFIPIITGRSSAGRYSISAHQEAGFGDIGFNGRWTLQLSSILPVKIYAGMEICQVYFLTPHGKISSLYHGKYQGSEEPVASRIHRDFK